MKLLRPLPSLTAVPLLLAALGAELALSASPPRPPQEPAPAEGGIPTPEYAERRRRLLDTLGAPGPVVIRGAEPPAEDYLRFRQRNDFLYLSGIDQPGALLLITPPPPDDPDAPPRAVAFLPPFNPFAERWSGPQVVPGPDTAARFKLDAALPLGDFDAQLAAALGLSPSEDDGDGDGDSAPADPPALFTHLARGRDAEHSADGRFEARLKQLAPGVPLRDLSGGIASLRLIKSEAELALIQAAIDMTIEGHRDAARVIRPGAFEYEAQGALEYAFTRNGARRPAFASIVGAGPNSVILHYNANRRRMQDGDLVVIDVGAEFHAYAADITRTYPVSGRFNDRQRAVYRLVLDAQRAAEAVFEPGKTTLADLQRAAADCMKASPLRDAEGRTLDRSFVHGIGHWLGMDVHDVGSTRRPIPAGAVFTIEPGIYLADEQLGVRIEDDYLATEDGLVKLSAALPSEPDEIEALMATSAAPADPDQPVP
ncbi:aminopeptidase P N-terminal domain-containing protein [Tautonia sp. JC769]|uniref:aminopeptidase P N-terminal domain-containing protein n=1 Tax=Tautonia sp. JC769 TaxID=3232135 RepID=UPI003459E4BE